jgi:hypothetical protein
MRPAFRGLGRVALERRIFNLVALSDTTDPRIRRARMDRAFALQLAWRDMERAEALKNQTKGVTI